MITLPTLRLTLAKAIHQLRQNDRAKRHAYIQTQAQITVAILLLDLYKGNINGNGLLLYMFRGTAHMEEVIPTIVDILYRIIYRR